MIQFLAFSKSLLYPSYCYACDEPLQKSICFCQVCQSQIEFLDRYARCDVCFNKLDLIQGGCSHCQERRYFDKKVALFDSLSPIVSLVNQDKFIEVLANLFIIGIDHFKLQIPTKIIAEHSFFKKVAKQMMQALNITRSRKSDDVVMVIANEHISECFIDRVSNRQVKSLVALLLHSCN